MNNIKVILFDFDGTLVDSMKQYALAASEILTRESKKLTQDQAYQQYRASSGLSFPEQLVLIAPELSDKHPEMNKEFCHRKLEILNQISFIESTILTLTTLKKRGYQLGISSNNEIEIINQFLNKQTPYFNFDIILGLNHQMRKGKLHFNHVKFVFNVHETQILFVGDSLKDAQKAEESNIPFIGITGTFSKSEFKREFAHYPVIQSLSELLPQLM